MAEGGGLGFGGGKCPVAFLPEKSAFQKLSDGDGLKLLETIRICIRAGKELPIRHTGSSDRHIFCLVKMDRNEVCQSTAVPRLINPTFGDEFAVEVPKENFRQLHFYLCEQASGRIPNYRPFARSSFRKSDVIKYSGQDKWFPLKPYTRTSDVTGKICVEVSLEEVPLGSGDGSSVGGISKRVRLKVLDYSDLNLPSGGARTVDLYALVTLQSSEQRKNTQKLKIPHHGQRKQQAKKFQHQSSLSAPSNMSLDGAQPSSPRIPSRNRAGPPSSSAATTNSSSTRSIDSDAENSVTGSSLSINQPPSLLLEVDSLEDPLVASPNRRLSSDASGGYDPTLSSVPSTPGSTEESANHLRISLWHDLLGGFQSYFHGEVWIPLDSSLLVYGRTRTAWYYLKPRNSSSGSSSSGGEKSSPDRDAGSSSSRTFASGPDTSSSPSGKSLGFLRLKMEYQVDHYLPLTHYEELRNHLLDSVLNPLRIPKPQMPSSPLSPGGPSGPIRTSFSEDFHGGSNNNNNFVEIIGMSPVGVLRYLQHIRLDEIAAPLIKIFMQAQLLRPFIRCLFTEEMCQCRDVNTLFRSTSLATKIMNELLRLVGQQYLLVSLRPCIDRIFIEKECCEIDPTRIPNDQSAIENNTQKLIVYTETVFTRVVDSNHRCPQMLKDIFADLREITASMFPGRTDVQMLVLSSFLVLRFFSAAVLNPKNFGIKKENPDSNVSRTLTLVSKILQKIFNYAVCGHRPSSKEPFLNKVFDHFMDEKHHINALKFLDRISCKGGESSVSGDSVSTLREGSLIQRFPKQKACLELKWMTSKKRHCCLTEMEFMWGKGSESSKGRLVLSDVTRAQAAEEEEFRGKHVFRIGTDAETVFLQAQDHVEMTEWIKAIQKQCNRQRLSSRESSEVPQFYEIELERELESIHMKFLEHVEHMRLWKGALNGSIAMSETLTPIPSPDHLLQPPEPGAFEPTTYLNAEANGQLYQSLDAIMTSTYNLETEHQKALAAYLGAVKLGSKDNPIGDENYLLLKARMKDHFGMGQGKEGDGTHDVLPEEDEVESERPDIGELNVLASPS